VPAQGDAVVEDLDPEDPLGVGSGQLRPDGRGAGGHHQLVERLVPLAARLEVAHLHYPAVQVDADHLVTQLDVGGETRPEHLGAPGDQLFLVVDDVGHQIGDPTGGVRRVPAPFEHDDLEFVGPPAPPRLAYGAHPRRVATDHHQPVSHRRNLLCERSK
jgi:hypothetical protein